MTSYRKATMADKEKILALPHRFSHKEYILYVYDEWVRKERGGIYVVESGGGIVAFAAVDFLKGDEAWFYALRVGMEYEGRGIATGFTEYLVGEARELGGSVARLMTNKRNDAIHHMVGQKLGFKRAADWIVYFGVPIKGLEMMGSFSCREMPYMASSYTAWAIHSFEKEDIEPVRFGDASIGYSVGKSWNGREFLLIRYASGEAEDIKQGIISLGELEGVDSFAISMARDCLSISLPEEFLREPVLYELKLG